MPTQTDATADTAVRYGAGPLRGAIVVAGVWHIVADLNGTVAGWSQYRSPLVVAAAWIAFTTVGAVTATRLLRGGGEGRVPALVGLVVLVTATAAQAAACRPWQTFTLAHWAWANFGWFAMLVVWRLPVSWLFAAMGSEVAVTLVSLLATRDMGRIELARYFTTVYGAGAIEMGVAWGARVLEKRAKLAAAAADEQLAVRIARASAEHVHIDRQRRYQDLGQTVRELLDALATGSLRPDAADTRRRCAVEASRLRRLIAEHDDAPSRLVHELRACADIAERRGVVVTLEVAGEPPNTPVATRRALTDAPMHALAAARSQARITVWSPDDTEVEISIVADAELTQIQHELVEDVATQWEKEEDTLWLRTRWRRP